MTSKVVLETTDKMQHTLGGSEDGDIIEVSQHAFPTVLAELMSKVCEGRLQTQTEQSWAYRIPLLNAFGLALAATRRRRDDPTRA